MLEREDTLYCEDYDTCPSHHLFKKRKKRTGCSGKMPSIPHKKDHNRWRCNRGKKKFISWFELRIKRSLKEGGKND